MAEARRRFEQDFRDGAVRLVRETGKPIAQVARELGIHDGTLGNWVNAERRRRGESTDGLGEDERAELVRLRRENAELRMRCDVLKRSMALWVQDAVGAGSRGRLHRRPEGAVRHPVRGGVPGAGGVAVLVLQVAPRGYLATAGPPAGVDGAGGGLVRPASGHVR